MFFRIKGYVLNHYVCCHTLDTLFLHIIHPLPLHVSTSLMSAILLSSASILQCLERGWAHFKAEGAGLGVESLLFAGNRSMQNECHRCEYKGGGQINGKTKKLRNRICVGCIERPSSGKVSLHSVVLLSVH
jgi:hypothetical protein